MFLSGDGTETVKTVKINDKFEKINFTKWLIDSRCLSHKLVQRGGHELSSYDLYVRYFIYNNKMYAFNIEPNDSFYLQIPLQVQEDGIVSAYQIALDIKYYQDFIIKYLNICINKLGSGAYDDLSKLIIEFFNNIIEHGEAFPTKDTYFNMWNFDPMNYNEEYHMRNTRKIREEFNPGDLVKLIDNKKNVTHYGLLEHFNKKEDYILGHFKCFLLGVEEIKDEEEEICFKYFLPEFDTGVTDLLAKKPRFEFKKADVSELSDEIKELYSDELKEINNSQIKND